MSEFDYTVQNHVGRVQRGRLQAESATVARHKLVEMGLRPLAIRAVLNRSQGRWSRLERFLNSLLPTMHNGACSIRSLDIELFLQQLSVMIDSGLELTDALHQLSQQASKKSIRRLSARLCERVNRGGAFSAALEAEPVMPELVRELAQVGEKSGQLAVTLHKSADYLQRKREAVSNLLAALAYPSLVAVAAVGVAAYLVLVAIPKLAVFLHAMGRKLPTMTQSLLDLAQAVREYGPGVLVVLLALGVALGLLYAWPTGRVRLDRCLLRIPIIGHLLRISATQQLAGSVALMLRSGVLLQDALATAAALHHNRFLAARVHEARQQVTVGGNLASGLDDRRAFPPMLTSMIAVGERTGELATSLEQVANFYESQLTANLNRLSRLVEPAIIIVVGSMVGYVYVAFFIALLSAGGNFQ